MNDSIAARNSGQTRRRRGYQGAKSRKRFAFSKQRRKQIPLTPWQKIAAFFSKLFGVGKPARKSGSADSKQIQSQSQESQRPASASKGADRKRDKTSRPPVIQEVTSPRLYIGNLSYDATESDLFELFNGVGKVRNAEVVSHKSSHRSKGFAFIEMQSLDEAKRAVVELHDKEFMGRKLVVSGARPEPRA